MIREVSALFYLAIAGFMDYRKKTVPIILPIVGFVYSVVLCCVLEDVSENELIYSVVPGVVFILVSIATAGKIGIGDGLILIPFELMSGFWDSVSSLLYALVSMSFVALFLLSVKKRNGNYQLPFLPYLLCGLVLTYLIKLAV